MALPLPLVLVIVLYLVWRVVINKKIAGTPPVVPGSWPLLGHLVPMLRDPLNFFLNARKTCGPMYTVNMLWTQFVVVADKNLYAEYFRYREDKLSFRQPIQEMHIEHALFNAHSSKYTYLNIDLFRKIMGENYGEAVKREVAKNIDELPEKGEIDLIAFGRRTVCNVTSQLVFGTRLSDELCEALLDFDKNIGILAVMGLFSLGFIARNIQLPKIAKKRAIVLSSVTKLIAQARSNPALQSVYLKRAFALQDDGKPISDEVVAQLANAAIFAGVANTSYATANVLSLLADYPSTVEGLKVEDGVLENPEIQKWMMECARVSQGFFGSMRMATKDIEFGGYMLPKGTWTIVDRNTPFITSECHNIPPSIFAPERWKEDGQDQYQNAVLNWGAGVHLCPGMFFALAEMKYMLACAMQLLNIEPAAKKEKGKTYDLMASFQPQTSQIIRKYEKKRISRN